MALVASAQAQPAYAPHSGGGFQRAPAVSTMSGGAPRGGWGTHVAAPSPREAGLSGYRTGNGGSGRYGAAPVRIADQGGRRERGGRSVNRQADRVSGGGYGSYRTGPITPVSAEARAVPHPPADSPVRAGSIREDVARYNEERSSFRPLPRNGGEVPRPPMPSPYRN